MDAKRLVNILAPVILIAAVFYLGWQIVSTGMRYNYDFDELQNAQTIYLIARGEIPFGSFFSVYSPVFHILLVPVLEFSGYSFSGMFALRIVMLVLLIARLILLYLASRKIFGNTASFIVVALLILDPFMHFTGMQVRPDNLMITVFAAAFFLLAGGVKNGNTRSFFWSGMLFSASAVISLKILPSLAVIYLAVFLRALFTKNFKSVFQLLAGSVLPAGLFIALCIYQGTFSRMVQQLFFDAPLTNATRFYPTHPSYYYMPNEFLYGLGGKTPLWIYFTALPAVSLSGLMLWLFGRKNPEKSGVMNFFVPVFLALAAVNWIYIYTIPSAFIQYFVPLTWIYPFGISVLYLYFRTYPLPKPVKAGIIIILIFIYFVVFNAAVKSNNDRRTLISDAIKIRYTELWKQIPENAKVFPGMLFRPLSYPFQYGYFIVELPGSIRDRYPAPVSVLKSSDVRYAMISDYMLGLMDPESREYIASHFTRSGNDPELMLKTSD